MTIWFRPLAFTISRFSIIMLSVVPWVLTARSQAQDSQSIVAAGTDHLARYATDGFFAGAYLNLDAIYASKGYQNFPFDLMIPSDVIFDRFRPSPISEMAVFLESSADTEPQSTDLPMAAAVRLNKSMDPKQAIAAISKTLHPFRERALEIETLNRDGREVHTVPSGTFLSANRRTGRLHFTDEKGQIKEKGISIGDIAPLTYVRGGRLASAVFTFDGLDKSDIIEGGLAIAIRMSVFRTQYLEAEYDQAHVFLRRPGGGLTTRPIQFDAISFVEKRFNFGSKLQSSSGEEVDLFKDLLVNGEVEVVLQTFEPVVYLGFESDSVAIMRDAQEYIAVDGQNLAIAQSLERLGKMLEKRGQRKLSKLNQTGNEISIAASVGTPVQRQQFKLLLQKLGLKKLNEYLTTEAFSIHGSLMTDESVTGELKVVFPDSTQASRASRSIRRELSLNLPMSKEYLIEANRRLNTMDRLAGMVFSEIVRGCPAPGINLNQFESHLENAVEGFFDGVSVEQNKRELAIRYSPVRSMANKRLDQLALAAMELIRANELTQFKHFHVGDRVHCRATERLSNEPSAWARRAHQLAYNNSVVFEGYTRRYDWIRRGINVLLDGAEKNPKVLDLILATGTFIGHKIGKSDDQKHFQVLFAGDQVLHERLGAYIDLEKTKSQAGEVECWLVAKLIFEECLRRHEEQGQNYNIEPFEFYARPSRAQAFYAEELDARGEVESASRQWAIASEMYNELGKSPIVVAGTFTLDETDGRAESEEWGTDLKHRLSPGKIGVAERIQSNRRLYRDWKWRAKWEQSEAVRHLRRDAFVARKHLRETRFEKANEEFSKLMNAIESMVANTSDQNKKLFIKAVGPIISDYQEVCRQRNLPVESRYSPIIEIHKQQKLDWSLPWH